MNRKVIVILGILLVALVSTPIWLGMHIQKNINEKIKLLAEHISSASSGITMNIDSIDYQRGWFSSHAKITGKILTEGPPKTLKSPGNSLQPIIDAALTGIKEGGSDLNADINIKHGPLLFLSFPKHPRKIGAAVAESKITININSSRKKNEDIPLNIISSIGIFGDFLHHIQLPAHKQELGKLTTIEWLDADLELTHNNDFSDYDSELELDNLQLSHKLIGSLTIKDMDIRESFTTDNKTISYSSAFIADELSMMCIGGNSITFEEFSVELITTVNDEGVANFSYILNMDKIKSTKNEYGETYVAIQGYDFNFNNSKKILDDLGSLDLTNSVEPLFEITRKIFTKNTRVEIMPALFHTGSGPLRVSGTIKPKYPLPKVDNNSTPFDLLDSINIDVNASNEVARSLMASMIKYEHRLALLEKANHKDSDKHMKDSLDIEVTEKMILNRLDQLEKAGIIVLNENGYKIKFTYSNNQFSFNGNIL